MLVSCAPLAATAQFAVLNCTSDQSKIVSVKAEHFNRSIAVTITNQVSKSNFWEFDAWHQHVFRKTSCWRWLDLGGTHGHLGAQDVARGLALLQLFLSAYFVRGLLCNYIEYACNVKHVRHVVTF